MVSMTLVSAPGGAAAKQSSTTPSCNTKDDPWPAYTQGRPAGINPKTTAATYMWHDNGWNIRVTHHTTNRRTFSGQLVTNGTFTGVKPVHLEKSDQFSVSGDKHVITFNFKNYGFIDGLNFYTHCATSITVSYQSDGSQSPPSKIVIGRNSVSPPTNPFMVTRTSPTPVAATH